MGLSNRSAIALRSTNSTIVNILVSWVATSWPLEWPILFLASRLNQKVLLLKTKLGKLLFGFVHYLCCCVPEIVSSRGLFVLLVRLAQHKKMLSACSEGVLTVVHRLYANFGLAGLSLVAGCPVIGPPFKVT